MLLRIISLNCSSSPYNPWIGLENNSKVRKKLKKTFEIPDRCDNSKISAKLNNGILEISLPKKVLPKPKVIKIN